jgi:hypothetical protein
MWMRTGKKEFKPPTTGLEHLIFKQGDAANAAAFDDNKKALAKYAGVKFKIGSAMAQTVMEKLVEPSLMKPNNPPPLSLPPTVNKEVAREEWKYELEDYVKKKRPWEDTKGQAFQLVMSHVNPELESKLESSARWETINHDHRT